METRGHAELGGGGYDGPRAESTGGAGGFYF